MIGYFEHTVTVDFDHTTFSGEVHFVTFMRWQGVCRDRFLRTHAAEVLDEGTRLHTVRAECEFFSALTLDDEVSIRMRLEELSRRDLQFTFDFVRLRAGREALVARGRQRVVCVERTGLAERQVPLRLREALLPYVESPVLTA